MLSPKANRTKPALRSVGKTRSQTLVLSEANVPAATPAAKIRVHVCLRPLITLHPEVSREATGGQRPTERGSRKTESPLQQGPRSRSIRPRGPRTRLGSASFRPTVSSGCGGPRGLRWSPLACPTQLPCGDRPRRGRRLRRPAADTSSRYYPSRRYVECGLACPKGTPAT